MVKPLDSKGRKKWYGYLNELENYNEHLPLTDNQIKKCLEGWKGHLIDPEKTTLTPIIESVGDKNVNLKFQSGKRRPCSYREIINSEKIIRFWLAKGVAPESKDFRNPDQAIDAESIANDTYAPALAERIRKQFNIDHMLPPEICILPMSPNEFTNENFNSINDVQEEFILGMMISEGRNGSYRYRHRTLNAPRGSVVLFQFKSNIIGSGTFLYSQPFDGLRDGYKGEMMFDVKSLKTFSPLNQEQIRKFWPEFNNFNQAFQRLDPSNYVNFVASLNNIKFGTITGRGAGDKADNKKVNKALSLPNWKQGGKYYRLKATANNKWVGFQESVIRRLQTAYGNEFFLVIWSDKNKENDFYNIPFRKLKHLFIDQYKTTGNLKHRWTATIKNHEFLMRDNSQLTVNISADYGNMHTEDNIELCVREDLLAYEYENEYFEGKTKYRFSSYHERNLKLRAEAIKIHGLKCEVCGFDFEATYGPHGTGFIEVHHLKPVSSLERSTKVDPRNDMIVVCPNCHRMLHRKKDNVLTPVELKRMLKTPQ